MNTSPETDQVFAALAAAQAGFKKVQKSGHNKQQNYKYAVMDDYLDAVRASLAEHGLALCGSADSVEVLPGRETGRGGTMLQSRIHTTLRLCHTSGQWIEGGAYGDGEDSTDKAIYKATTGARKYALCCLLGLSTTDDPEIDAREPEAPQPATDEQIAKMEEWSTCPDLDDKTRAWLREKLDSDKQLTFSRAKIGLARLSAKYGGK